MRDLDLVKVVLSLIKKSAISAICLISNIFLSLSLSSEYFPSQLARFKLFCLLFLVASNLDFAFNIIKKRLRLYKRLCEIIQHAFSPQTLHVNICLIIP